MRVTVSRSVAPLLLASAFAGCGGKETDTEPIDPSTPGMHVLGSGTDVFGAYAVEGNVKGRVLDVSAMNEDGLIEFNAGVAESRYEEAQGNTISEYASSLASSVGLSGSYMFFSAEIKASYAQDTYRKTGYSYASIIERHWKHALKVQPGLWTSAARLRSYLTPLAKQAINDTDTTRKWSAAEVIASYGTHVMNGIYVGGRLDYHLTVQIMAAEYRQSLMAYAKMKFKTSFASAELKETWDDEVWRSMESYQDVVTINAKGGAAQYANPSSDGDYQRWKATLETNPVFCGIMGGSLIGVWELADSPARRDELRTAFEAYAAQQAESFVPMMEKITDIKVIDAGQSTSVTPPTGYQLLATGDGDTVGGSLSSGIWNDLKLANYVFVAYKSEVTSRPVGISEVHVSSSEAAVVDLFFGGSGGAGHDAKYGVAKPGCLANAGANLNSGACGAATIWDWYSGWCAFYFWSARCDRAATPLALHHVLQTEQTEAIRCVVVGDEIAVDANQPLNTRKEHIHFGPADVNQDGKKDGDDATWVLEHVQWVRTVGGALVNLNHGTQSFHRYDWYDCGLGEGYDEAWIRPVNNVADAQYIGACVP